MIRAATVRLIPPEQAAEIGDRMLIALIEAHGPPCGDPEGERALGAAGGGARPGRPAAAARDGPGARAGRRRAARAAPC